MGLVRAEITLANPVRRELEPVAVSALVDSGALHLCLPQHLALQLQLAQQSEREVTLADGQKRLVPYAGPVEVRFGNRRCFVGAMILGDEPLLGAIPMEDMDLVIHKARQELSVNPQNPNIAASVAK